jgi:transposase
MPHVRITTAFNRILQLPGASVRTVAFTDQGMVIELRRRRRRLQCPCGATTAARYDSSRRRWRHLDFGACQVWLEADIHRINCRNCGRVRTEQVPWGTPERPPHQRLRERRRLARPADGQDRHQPTAALLLGSR